MKGSGEGLPAIQLALDGLLAKLVPPQCPAAESEFDIALDQYLVGVFAAVIFRQSFLTKLERKINAGLAPTLQGDC